MPTHLSECNFCFSRKILPFITSLELFTWSYAFPKHLYNMLLSRHNHLLGLANLAMSSHWSKGRSAASPRWAQSEQLPWPRTQLACLDIQTNKWEDEKRAESRRWSLGTTPTPVESFTWFSVKTATCVPCTCSQRRGTAAPSCSTDSVGKGTGWLMGG